nr:hypothetical protein CparaKRNrm1_p110 [Cryptomonas paramecium]
MFEQPFLYINMKFFFLSEKKIECFFLKHIPDKIQRLVPSAKNTKIFFLVKIFCSLLSRSLFQQSICRINFCLHIKQYSRSIRYLRYKQMYSFLENVYTCFDKILNNPFSMNCRKKFYSSFFVKNFQEKLLFTIFIHKKHNKKLKFQRLEHALNKQIKTSIFNLKLYYMLY